MTAGATESQEAGAKADFMLLEVGKEWGVMEKALREQERV